MINIYTQIAQGEAWIAKYRDRLPVFACILGFTETGLIPGISAAGRTPEDRQYTACADAEFLYYGAEHQPLYPLPPLAAGASPVVISRAVVEALKTPVYLFNAGLPTSPAVTTIDLGGCPARCLSQGNAMELATVHYLLEQGLLWGSRLAADVPQGYLVLGECVVGGTTTALAILTGLGIPAEGKVNSSHPVCNHEQKSALVQAGLEKMRERGIEGKTDYELSIQNPKSVLKSLLNGGNPRTASVLKSLLNGGNPRTATFRKIQNSIDPLQLVAAVGDPMQVVVAGMAIAASHSCGVLLAGGTQMLAVYALMNAIAQTYSLAWKPEAVVVGTTRWVAEDPTGATVELALSLGKQDIIKGGKTPPLLATQLSFTDSRYPQLQAYEQGFVKEGMGAGGAAIAAHLSLDWQQHQLLEAIEEQLERLSRFNNQ